MKQLKFDFNNMFGHTIGKVHGVTEAELKKISGAAAKVHGRLRRAIGNPSKRMKIGLEWTRLPFQDKRSIKDIQRTGEEIAEKYENVISLGIGGSYLGLKAAQDALCRPYYNDFLSERLSRPRIYFEGNNLDPDTLSVLLRNLDPKRTLVIVISKSGETTETKAAFMAVEGWLKQNVGSRYGRQIFAITDPASGSLRKRIDEEQAKDRSSFRNLHVMRGVGGRFSELNIGLLHLAIVGVTIQEVLDGAAAMSEKCLLPGLFKNPAGMYAALQTVLYKKKAKDIAILMPFSERLKSTADWYVQLLAESLGKKNMGRTPVSARGTNDLHSIQQNNVEGENNKTFTFIKVERFKDDIEIRCAKDFLDGEHYSRLLSLAAEATEWALVRRSRPNCAITMPEITPFHWGELIYFFEMATAYEGGLLGINAYDQPGVEGYKNYMYYKLARPGLSETISGEIRAHPLMKSPKYII